MQLAFDLLANERMVPFSIGEIIDNSVTDFDLFIEVNKHHILYCSEGYTWYRDELEGLLAAGHKEFLIREVDQNKVGMYRQLSKLPTIEKNLKPAERIQSIEQIGLKFIEQLYEGEITPAAVYKAESLADAMVNTIAEDPACIRFLGQLADRDYYTFVHSMRVATYSVAIAMKLGIKDQAHLNSIALGGIFHDIGKKDVPLDVLNKAGALTDAEWKKMKAHPEKGQEYLEGTTIPFVSQEIIIHHHERLDGSGYPHNLRKSDLIDEVQIATISDIFDALTSSRSYQNKRSRFEALDLIKHKLLGTHLASEPFRALVSCLTED
jgi:putative nucleotidyltransferase with HDIG domain